MNTFPSTRAWLLCFVWYFQFDQQFLLQENSQKCLLAGFFSWCVHLVQTVRRTFRLYELEMPIYPLLLLDVVHAL